MDHIIPVSDPRSAHVIENLRLTHAKCNNARRNSRDRFSLTGSVLK
ncbi:HNH endonuclease [Citricoccus sp. NR2]